MRVDYRKEVVGIRQQPATSHLVALSSSSSPFDVLPFIRLVGRGRKEITKLIVDVEDGGE